MLVHKTTMGVLSWYWTGRYKKAPDGTTTPIMVEYTFDSHPELLPDEWWEVPARSRLGRALIAAYPYCEPVVDGMGDLIDIARTDPAERSAQGGRKEEQIPRQRKQRRRKGMFSHLL